MRSNIVNLMVCFLVSLMSSAGVLADSSGSEKYSDIGFERSDQLGPPVKCEPGAKLIIADSTQTISCPTGSSRCQCSTSWTCCDNSKYQCKCDDVGLANCVGK